MSISVTFEENQRVAAVYGPWQYDYGQELTVSGLPGLPEAVPVQFAREGSSTAATMLGRFSDGILTVPIPDDMLRQAGTFWAYLFVVSGDSGRTVTGVKFLPYARPAPEDTITPDQQSAFDALVSELNVLIASVMQVNDTAAASAQAAQASAQAAEGNQTAAEQSKAEAAQALSDLLAMLGTDIATLVGGKLNPSQIPDLSINEVFSVANTNAMLALNAQRGDCALIVANDTVSDSYLLAADDPAALANWKKLGVSYVANAGHAVTADEAANAATINNHRVVAMTQEQYDGAVKDPDTIYLVG